MAQPLELQVHVHTATAAAAADSVESLRHREPAAPYVCVLGASRLRRKPVASGIKVFRLPYVVTQESAASRIAGRSILRQHQQTVQLLTCVVAEEEASLDHVVRWSNISKGCVRPPSLSDDV